MLRKIAVVLLLVLACFVALVASRPSAFRIARGRTLAAPPDVVYGYVSDFKTWPSWSPWEKIDPAMKRELSGASSGLGAVYHWSGNSEVGEGRMTITEARPGKALGMRLEFMRPFAATNTASFTFTPAGQGTNVIWAMAGENNFVAKAIGVFMDVDGMIGSSFEQGLTSLDAVTGVGRKPVAAAAGRGLAEP